MLKSLIPIIGTYQYTRRRYSNSVGIMAFVGDQPQAVDSVVQGLKEQQNKGYDSAGISMICNNQVNIIKYANKGQNDSDSLTKLFQESQKYYNQCKTAIGHTRWRTIGDLNDQSAHPHSDYKDRVMIVHNGEIENYEEIRKLILDNEIPLKTKTDSELIAQLIGLYLDEGHSTQDAIQYTLERLEGTWGLVVMDTQDPEHLYAASNGANMYLGFSNQKVYISSDLQSFSNFTNKYVKLNNQELIQIGVESTQEVLERIQITPSDYKDSLGMHPHWWLKEILDQSKSAANAIKHGGRITQDGAKLAALDQMQEQLLQIRNLVLVGTGASLFACEYGAQLLREVAVFNSVQIIDSGDLMKSCIPSINPGAISVSQSGETPETLKATQLLKDQGIPMLTITNQVGSSLSQMGDQGIYTNAGIERGIASSKSFINSCVIFAQIALWFSNKRHPESIEFRRSLIESLFKLPIVIGSVINSTKEQCLQLSKLLKNSKSMFLLGSGHAFPICKEGALLMKEVSKVHAEAYPGGALKHGPFALLEENTPVIFVILDDGHQSALNKAIDEVNARGGHTIVITPNVDLITSKPKDVILIQENGPMTGLLAIIPLQLLAYYMCVQKGLNPDTPRTYGFRRKTN